MVQPLPTQTKSTSTQTATYDYFSLTTPPHYVQLLHWFDLATYYDECNRIGEGSTQDSRTQQHQGRTHEQDDHNMVHVVVLDLGRNGLYVYLLQFKVFDI